MGQPTQLGSQVVAYLRCGQYFGADCHRSRWWSEERKVEEHGSAEVQQSHIHMTPSQDLFLKAACGYNAGYHARVKFIGIHKKVQEATNANSLEAYRSSGHTRTQDVRLASFVLDYSRVTRIREYKGM